MSTKERKSGLRLYYGFGNGEDFFLPGHAIAGSSKSIFRPSSNLFRHNLRLAKMYLNKGDSGARIRLHFMGQQFETVADEWGYFEFKGKTTKHSDVGWITAKVELLVSGLSEPVIQETVIFIPEPSPFLIVSDIDDTVLISHSTRPRKRLRELLFRHTHKRRVFAEVAELYAIMEELTVSRGKKNPVFYVSASEWNLFPYIRLIFEKQGLPKGPFLLHPRKHWSELLSRNTAEPAEKKDRIELLLHFYPDRKFILLGDNSQADPIIYQQIALTYPNRLAGIFIRLIRKKKAEAAQKICNDLQEMGIPTCLFHHSPEVSEKITQALGTTQ